MTREHGGATWTIPALDVLTSSLALASLLPIAGSLPGVASQGQPFSDAMWFTANLGGAFLLLASGMKELLRKTRLHAFILLYLLLISILGILRLQLVGFNFLAGGWLLMAFCVAGLLLLLRRTWLWATVGTIWCIFLLGVWSVGGIVGFLSIESRQLSPFLALQVVAFFLALVVLALHLRKRSAQASA